jgi:pyruvate, water dikinase
MEQYGLSRGLNGLRVFLMAEVPSNFLMADIFAPLIDGFSIGSNDLTQLVLGLDRDSHLVSHIYNERNAAVKIMISQLIKTAKKHGIKCGICGSAPSDYVDFTQFLVEEGIDSISIVPDALFKTVELLKSL